MTLTFSSPLTYLLCFSLLSSNLPSFSVPFFLPTFFPSCLWPQISAMVLQLFAAVMTLYRYLSSFLHQASHVKGVSNKFVFLTSDQNCSASLRCHYEPWFLQVHAKCSALHLLLCSLLPDAALEGHPSSPDFPAWVLLDISTCSIPLTPPWISLLTAVPSSLPRGGTLQGRMRWSL